MDHHTRFSGQKERRNTHRALLRHDVYLCLVLSVFYEYSVDFGDLFLFRPLGDVIDQVPK